MKNQIEKPENGNGRGLLRYFNREGSKILLDRSLKKIDLLLQETFFPVKLEALIVEN